jgi:glycosyltransferase involved in cell wall biosynthesis
LRILMDYRPALRVRSGVGEYAHGLASSYLTLQRSRPLALRHELTLFSSSWKDRLDRAAVPGAAVCDRRVPVGLLNFAWHRLEWPPIERLAGGGVDVAHSLHPLLLPARRAAQVVTVHDLDFLDHPERTTAEIRRDYASLAGPHARRADQVVAVSRFTAGEVERRLDVPRERISLVSPGAPSWTARDRPPADGYLLFLGTLEPRKNVGTLLDAYARLLGRRPAAPDLVLAGAVPSSAAPLVAELGRPPLAGKARAIGYVDPDSREALYRGARLMVLPSFIEGFGLPALEAMTAGVPVVAASRGSLPEVLDDAGLLFDPEDAEALAAALDRALTDTAWADAAVERGLARARQYTWDAAARALDDAYQRAVEVRQARDRRADG